MNEKAEFRIVQSYFGYAVIGAILTASAAVFCYHAGEILVGLIPAALFAGIIDVMFRKTVTIVDTAEKSVTLTEYSLWRRSKRSVYQADEIEQITVELMIGGGPGLFHYQVSLRPKNERKKRLKVLISKRKAEDLGKQIEVALHLGA